MQLAQGRQRAGDLVGKDAGDLRRDAGELVVAGAEVLRPVELVEEIARRRAVAVACQQVGIGARSAPAGTPSARSPSPAAPAPPRAAPARRRRPRGGGRCLRRFATSGHTARIARRPALNDEYTPPKVWTWNKENGGRFANINRPIAGADARQGAAGRPPSAAALFARHAERREGHGDARGAARARPRRRRVRRLADPHQRGRRSSAAASSPSTRTRRSRRCSTAAGRSRSASSSPARSCSTWPRSSARFLPTEPARARRVPVVAVLADGQRAVSRRRLRPLLRLCADQDRIRDRPLRDGGEAPARRARPAPRREPRTWPATTTRSPTWRSGPGTARSPRASSTAPASSCRCRSYTHVLRWTDEIAQRPAVKRGRMVNRTWGEPSSQLHERHDASDFDTQDPGQAGAAALTPPPSPQRHRR